MMRQSLLLVILTLYSCSTQETCQTPSNRTGICMNIDECTPLVNVLKSRPLTPESSDALRQLNCGFDGETVKICCVQQTSVTTTEAPPPTNAIPNPPEVSNHPNIRFLDDVTCGTLTQSKIFGGNTTGVFDFPWMALLMYKNKSSMETSFLCGGTLINKQYVLTAAHCIPDLSSDRTLIGVRLGEHNLSTEVDCDVGEPDTEPICAEKYQELGIESIHYHPNFLMQRLTNDIALLRLSAGADLRAQNVQPICLPIPLAAKSTRKKKVTVTGWGITEKGIQSESLLKVQLPLVNNEECAKIYEPYLKLEPTQMCAGGVAGMSSCQGDSGGPLQSPGYYGNNTRYIQYGIISLGTQNCSSGLPIVSVNVVHYVDWILNTIKP